MDVLKGMIWVASTEEIWFSMRMGGEYHQGSVVFIIRR